MSRAEVRKEDRLEAQKEFEQWLSEQTAPRQAPPKKQMQNEESLAPVDDKERSAVAVRTHVQNGGPRGISRPSSDGFRPRAGQRNRPLDSVPQQRAWNSQRGPQRPVTAAEVASPPRSRATTMADSLNPNYADPAVSPPGSASGGSSAPVGGRSPTRKSPTPRPGASSIHGRPKTPTPRPGSNGRARRPPSARKENGVRNGRPSSGASPAPRPPSAPTAVGSGRAPGQQTTKRKTLRATPRTTKERPPPGGTPAVASRDRSRTPGRIKQDGSRDAEPTPGTDIEGHRDGSRDETNNR